MKRLSAEWRAGAVRWATIGVVTGAAALSGCRGVESVRPVSPVDTIARVCAVQGLIVTPATASLNVGQTVQLSAAQPCTTTRSSAFVFASSAPSVAVVDSRSGVVTAARPGTAIIIVTDSANAGTQGTSAITVVPIPMGLTIRSIADTAGNPAKLDSIAGIIVVVLNVETGGSFLNEADLVLNCGTGDVVAASTNPSASNPGSLVTMSVNTAARDSSGTLRYPNGACTLKVRLMTMTGQVFWSSNTVSLVLKN